MNCALTKVFYYFAAEDEAGRCWYPGVACWWTLVTRTLGFCGLDLDGQLGAVNTLEVVDALAAQALAQDTCQRVVQRLFDIANTPCSSIEFVGGTHRTDERYALPHAAADEFHLGRLSCDRTSDVLPTRQRRRC